MDNTLAYQIATLIEARQNCIKRIGRDANDKLSREWLDRHGIMIRLLVKNHMPSGSGFDNGTSIDLEKSTVDKLVFHTSFHHMNEHGYYDGWTDHTVTVKPGFTRLDIRISGKNRNDIKDTIDDSFRNALEQIIPD